MADTLLSAVALEGSFSERDIVPAPTPVCLARFHQIVEINASHHHNHNHSNKYTGPLCPCQIALALDLQLDWWGGRGGHGAFYLCGVGQKHTHTPGSSSLIGM